LRTPAAEEAVLLLTEVGQGGGAEKIGDSRILKTLKIDPLREPSKKWDPKERRKMRTGSRI